MFDKQKIVEAGKAMTERNQDWRDVLLYAPGNAMIRVGLAFYASENLNTMNQKEKDEYHEFREMLERNLSAGELVYLVKSFERMGVQKAYEHYRELLLKKPQEEQDAGNREYSEIEKKMLSAISSGGGSAGGEGAVEESGPDEGNDGGEAVEEEHPAPGGEPQAAGASDDDDNDAGGDEDAGGGSSEDGEEETDDQQTTEDTDPVVSDDAEPNGLMFGEDDDGNEIELEFHAQEV